MTTATKMTTDTKMTTANSTAKILPRATPTLRTRNRADSDGDPQRDYCLEFHDEAERDRVLALISDPAKFVADYLAAEIDDGAEGHWIQTFSGERFFPAAPDASKIHLKDIAHSLANLTRYCGHCSSFYSVAEHSILVATEMAKKFFGPEHDIWSLWEIQIPEVELQMIRSAFLHDAPEAYVGDVTAPLKNLCKGFRIIESRVDKAVRKRFELRFPLDLKEIHECDVAVFLAEKDQLMDDSVEPWSVSGEPADVGKLNCWAPHTAEKMFLRAAKCLGL